jgi:hypothetical protein
MSVDNLGVENLTSATLFLLRGIGLKALEMKKIGFINAYIDDIHHEPHYDKSLYLLFKPENIEDLSLFVGQEKLRTAALVEDYDYDGGYVVLVYKFPYQYHREWDHFLKGEWSLFSAKYAELFPKEVSLKTRTGIPKKEVSIWNLVFNRLPELKEFWEKRIDVVLDDEMELWSIPDMNKEKLDITLFQPMSIDELIKQ